MGSGRRWLGAHLRIRGDTVWFNNVELVAAEKICRETVEYVSDIYKYSVAYTLLVGVPMRG